jgi:hypothetical protein
MFAMKNEVVGWLYMMNDDFVQSVNQKFCEK